MHMATVLIIMLVLGHLITTPIINNYSFTLLIRCYNMHICGSMSSMHVHKGLYTFAMHVGQYKSIKLQSPDQ